MISQRPLWRKSAVVTLFILFERNFTDLATIIIYNEQHIYYLCVIYVNIEKKPTTTENCLLLNKHVTKNIKD